MPWLPFYATEQDHRQLLEYLNTSPEIAFLVSDGPGKWVAVSSIDNLAPGRYSLWHVPSGSLPLLRKGDKAEGIIDNPFDGWSEERPGQDTSNPYFGPGHPGVIWLNVRAVDNTHEGQVVVGLSSFEWIGNHYRPIGFPADISTVKFWKSLRRWIKKVAVQVPRGGPTKQTAPEIWALSDTQSLFVSGAKGVINPILFGRAE
jgi:hypothetical protein